MESGELSPGGWENSDLFDVKASPATARFPR